MGKIFYLENGVSGMSLGQLRINKRLHKLVKVRASEESRTMQEITERLLEDYLSGKPSVLVHSVPVQSVPDPEKSESLPLGAEFHNAILPGLEESPGEQKWVNLLLGVLRSENEIYVKAAKYTLIACGHGCGVDDEYSAGVAEEAEAAGISREIAEELDRASRTLEDARRIESAGRQAADRAGGGSGEPEQDRPENNGKPGWAT